MSELGLPDFPKRATLDRKVAAYARKADEHRRGEHAATVKGCKACRKAAAA
jgi:hypothetical protein